MLKRTFVVGTDNDVDLEATIINRAGHNKKRELTLLRFLTHDYDSAFQLHKKKKKLPEKMILALAAKPANKSLQTDISFCSTLEPFYRL